MQYSDTLIQTFHSANSLQNKNQANLLIGLFTFFHSSLFERKVIIEEKKKEVPYHSSLKELYLQCHVNSKSAHTFRSNNAKLRKMLQSYKMFSRLTASVNLIARTNVIAYHTTSRRKAMGSNNEDYSQVTTVNLAPRSRLRCASAKK